MAVPYPGPSPAYTRAHTRAHTHTDPGSPDARGGPELPFLASSETVADRGSSRDVWWRRTQVR
jgi:hypothetical protein